MTNDAGKKLVAEAVLQYVKDDMIVGVGTGSTVNYFIENLATIKSKIEGAVASSIATETLLKSYSIPVIDLNTAQNVHLYVDGADEVNPLKQMVKGGGGALTREKIVATVAKKFVCIVDSSKKVEILGQFPVAVEVIPMARSFVARQIVSLGGDPVYRENFVTDNGNQILDVFNLKILDPRDIEKKLNAIVGVVECGVFACRAADIVLVGSDKEVKTL